MSRPHAAALSRSQAHLELDILSKKCGKIYFFRARRRDQKVLLFCVCVLFCFPDIWWPVALSHQAWAILEEKCGDTSKARKLFDAATVADNRHVAAWHGWANLELRAGNVKKARSLLNKGLKLCGANEYIFQTLALLEFRDGKVEEARSLLFKATQYNPRSAASWLVRVRAWFSRYVSFQGSLTLWFNSIRSSQSFHGFIQWQAWALMESENNLPDAARRLFQVPTTLLISGSHSFWSRSVVSTLKNLKSWNFETSNCDALEIWIMEMPKWGVIIFVKFEVLQFWKFAIFKCRKVGSRTKWKLIFIGVAFRGDAFIRFFY